MSEDEMITRLRKLGMNLYESRAYLALLAAKRLTARGLGQSAMVPQSRTYDILESLTKRGFATATPARPIWYAPVPPAQVLGFRYDAERKKIQERAAKIQEAAQTELDVIREAYTTLTKDLPSMADVESPLQHQVWVITKRQNIEDTMIGLIKEAKSQVLRVTKPPAPSSKDQLDPFYIVGMENRRFIYDALKRGVKMRWLSLTREIPTFVGLDVREPPERRYLEQDGDITEKFFVVDDRSVILNLRDPMSPGYGSVALVMQSRAVSSIFLEHFEKMWSKGRPLDLVISKIRLLFEDVCTELKGLGLGRTDVSVFRTISKLGASSQDVVANEMQKRRVERQDITASCEKLVRLGLVRKNNTLRLLMADSPANIKASITQGLRISAKSH